MSFFIQSCLVLLAARCLISSAMMIDGTPMTMDQAIVAAGSNSSKMYELMQDNTTVMIELDMLYDMSTYMEMRKEMDKMEEEDVQQGSRKRRKAIAGDYYRWANARVPYDIDPSSMTSNDIALIRAAIADYERYTCLRFPQATNERDRIRFQNGGGCSSYVGKIGGVQGISLASGCRYKGIIIHEMGHAIGFNHEQTRPDRGNKVIINTQNIQSGLEYNFMRHSPSQQQDYGVPYDYSSVMHYSQYAFSANGRITIQAREAQYQNAMGNREGLSFSDIRLANAMYSCSAHCNSRIQCPAGAFLGQDCKCYCDSGVRSDPTKVCGTVGPSVTTEEPTTAAPIACVDRQSSCGYWAREGYCSGDYRDYMMTNCPVACRFCSEITTTTAAPTTTAPPGSCADTVRSCPSWADAGYCQSNTYVMDACKKSCNLCGATAKCMETNQYCGAWAKFGACDIAAYSDFMRTNCPISCNICTSNDEVLTSSTPQPVKDCMNKRSAEYCHRKQKEGQCGRSPLVMRGCRKTCHLC